MVSIKLTYDNQFIPLELGIYYYAGKPTQDERDVLLFSCSPSVHICFPLQHMDCQQRGDEYIYRWQFEHHCTSYQLPGGTWSLECTHGTPMRTCLYPNRSLSAQPVPRYHPQWYQTLTGTYVRAAPTVYVMKLESNVITRGIMVSEMPDKVCWFLNNTPFVQYDASVIQRISEHCYYAPLFPGTDWRQLSWIGVRANRLSLKVQLKFPCARARMLHFLEGNCYTVADNDKVLAPNYTFNRHLGTLYMSLAHVPWLVNAPESLRKTLNGHRNVSFVSEPKPLRALWHYRASQMHRVWMTQLRFPNACFNDVPIALWDRCVAGYLCLHRKHLPKELIWYVLDFFALTI